MRLVPALSICGHEMNRGGMHPGPTCLVKEAVRTWRGPIRVPVQWVLLPAPVMTFIRPTEDKGQVVGSSSSSWPDAGELRSRKGVRTHPIRILQTTWFAYER